MSDEYIKEVRDKIFEIRVKIQLETDSKKKISLMDEEKKLLDEYKSLVVMKVTSERKSGVKK